MIEIKEWTWCHIKKRDKTNKKIKCPYCDVVVSAESNTQIVDEDSGVIKYTIHKCPACFMPIIISVNGEIIPKSQFLPFEDVSFLPSDIEELYNECRKCYLNECYFAVVMVARSILMHLAVNKGDTAGKRFQAYVEFLETKGYIGSKNKTWVDCIRELGNKYIHQMDTATEDDAKKTITFINQLLRNVYEMPNLV